MLAADFAATDVVRPEDVDLDNPPDVVVIAEGTNDDDRISAFVDDANQLHVIVNDDETVINSDDVDGIIVLAKDGNDRVHIDESVFQWTQIHGGEGNDGIQGGSGNDYINAGAGNDRVRGGAGNDLIIGGHGNDVLAGGLGNDAQATTACTAPSATTPWPAVAAMT